MYGIIGGKVYSAFYFFGFCGNDVLYLDPHLNQSSCNDLDDKNFMTYINKTVYKIPFKNLQSALTIGFLFRDIVEFRELYVFLKTFSYFNTPCFHVRFEPYKNENKLSEEEIKNILNDKDDF